MPDRLLNPKRSTSTGDPSTNAAFWVLVMPRPLAAVWVALMVCSEVFTLFWLSAAFDLLIYS